VINLRGKLGLNKSFVLDGVGKGGGLLLFWDDSIKIDILLYGLHHIDTLIWDGGKSRSVEGYLCIWEPRVQERDKMWELLRRIKSCQYAPWLMIGDFNKAMWSFEHVSNHRRPKKQMVDFREVLSYCDLHDIGFSGLPWTFDKKRKGGK
jgi:hypothetical protein